MTPMRLPPSATRSAHQQERSMNRFAIFTVAALSPLVLASAARAEVTVCNDFVTRVYVALAADDAGGAYAKGWWAVEPNACRAVDFPFEGTAHGAVLRG